MRPCGTVLRNSFATSMPGSRMVWTYSARPVTLSRLSVRGTERPICEPAFAAMCGASAMAQPRAAPGRRNGAPDIDPHQFALVRHRAARVRDQLRLVRRRIAGALQQRLVDALTVEHRFGQGQPRGFFGRGTGDDPC